MSLVFDYTITTSVVVTVPHTTVLLDTHSTVPLGWAKFYIYKKANYVYKFRNYNGVLFEIMRRYDFK